MNHRSLETNALFWVWPPPSNSGKYPAPKNGMSSWWVNIGHSQPGPFLFLRQHSMILPTYPHKERNSFINCWLKRPGFPLQLENICAGSSSGPSATVAVGIQFDALQKGYAWQVALLMLQVKCLDDPVGS